MPALKRTAAALITAAALTGTTLATAGTASAASYHCNTSSKTVDDPSYTGIWPDNWDLKTTICAKRSGSTVYTYAKITVNGPNFYADTNVFESARFHLQVKQSLSGPDKVKNWKNYYGVEKPLETTNHYGTYTTGVISWKAGSANALGDGLLQLNWYHDGKDYQNYTFTGSPVV
ncbi:hypothetical protein ACIO6T_30980 [Streptomyces sp. NPDC087532]|uniref:hypothetical protein n=1 Tax=Streptomyces sp. NPDC087532 TaxID=3365795 RepID=UPI00382652E2